MKKNSFPIIKNKESATTFLTERIRLLDAVFEEICKFKSSNYFNLLETGTITHPELLELENAYPSVHEILQKRGMIDVSSNTPWYEFFMNTGLYVDEWSFSTWERLPYEFADGGSDSLIKANGKKDLLERLRERYLLFLKDMRRIELGLLFQQLLANSTYAIFGNEYQEGDPQEVVVDKLINAIDKFGQPGFIKPLISLSPEGNGWSVVIIDLMDNQET